VKEHHGCSSDKRVVVNVDDDCFEKNLNARTAEYKAMCYQCYCLLIGSQLTVKYSLR